MATNIQIPKPLLDAVDRRANSLKMSRERLIVRALERELAQETEWSPEFFDRLSAVDSDTTEAVDEMLAAVHRARTAKSPTIL